MRRSPRGTSPRANSSVFRAVSRVRPHVWSQIWSRGSVLISRHEQHSRRGHVAGMLAILLPPHGGPSGRVFGECMGRGFGSNSGAAGSPPGTLLTRIVIPETEIT